MGPFASTDTLFPSTAADLDLFTDKEISGLVRVGLLKPPIAGTRDPHAPPPASKVEPASSSRKQDCSGSPSCHHPVTVAAGSQEDLGKSEHECEAARKRLHREIRAEHGQSTSTDLSHGLKHGRTIDAGVSDERPHPKEHRAERGRSRECKRFNSPEHHLPPPFLLTPMAPTHPTTGSVSVPSVDLNRGSSSLDRGAYAGVPHAHQASSIKQCTSGSPE